MGGRGLGALHFVPGRPFGPPTASSYSSDAADLLQVLFAQTKEWAEEDLNLHPLRDQILSLARLPVPPSAHDT
jgi:hypothetical protein